MVNSWNENQHFERHSSESTNPLIKCFIGSILTIFGIILLMISIGMNSAAGIVFSIFIILVGIAIIATVKTTATERIEWEEPVSKSWLGLSAKFKLLDEEEIREIPMDAIDLWTQERIWDGILRGERVYKCLGRVGDAECGLYYLESSLRESKRCANPYCSNH